MSALPQAASNHPSPEPPTSSGSRESDDLAPATWSDPKRYGWLLGLLIPTLPFLAWGLAEATGLSIFWYYGPIVVFGFFPLLDLVVGADARNPPGSVISWLEQDRYYRWCTYLYLPIQYAGLVLACWLWSGGRLSAFDSIGLALTVAMVSGVAINTAHELGHKRASSERWLSKVALGQSGYGHFFIEHHLQRHSDHHANRRYQALRHVEGAAAADRVCGHDPHGSCAPAVAAGDGSARARALRR